MCAFVSHPDHQTGVLKVVHAPRKFTTGGVPGRATAAGGHVFAHCDDVEGVDINTIALDEQWFGLTAEVNVPNTWDCVLELFNDEPNKELSVPLEKTAKDKRTVQTPPFVFLPFPLVQCALEKNLNA